MVYRLTFKDAKAKKDFCRAYDAREMGPASEALGPCQTDGCYYVFNQDDGERCCDVALGVVGVSFLQMEDDLG